MKITMSFYRVYFHPPRDTAERQYIDQLAGSELSLLYESPFTDIEDMGVEGVFQPDQVTHLINILEEVSKRAVA